MPQTFTITTPAQTVRGEAVFTVTNTTSAPERALVRTMPMGDTRPEWLSIDGEAERAFPPGATQVRVRANIPPGTAPGRYQVRLDVLSASRGGEDRTEGPTVAFEVVGAEEPKPKSRWWLWVALAVLLVIIAVAVYLWSRGRGEKPPTDPRADVPRNGVVLWLAADDAQPSPGASTVDYWQNPELAGPRASALSLAAQPTRVAEARNGHAVVRFDGVDDIMKTTIEFGRGRMQAATVFAVFSSTIDAPSPLRKLYGCDNGGFDPAVGLDDRAGTTNYGVFTGGGVIPYFALTANRYYLTSDVWKWTEFSGYVDGHLQIDHQPITSDTDTLPNLYLGGTGTVYYEYWQGDIAEVIVYSRALDDEERRKVEDYLAQKYAVTLNR